MKSKKQVVGCRNVVALAVCRTSFSIIYALLLLAGVMLPAMAQRGRIEKGQVTSAGLTNNLFGDKATRPYRVYLPPSYDTMQKRYPVIYVLHGDRKSVV